MFSWFRSLTETRITPQLEEYLNAVAGEVARLLSERRGAFSLATAFQELQVEPNYFEEVRCRAYRFFLRRAWVDGQITDGETQQLRKIAAIFGLSLETARDLDREVASALFSAALRRAIADGEIEAGEHALLRAIAGSSGKPLKVLADEALQVEGRAIIEQIAIAASATGRVDDDHWRRVTDMGRALDMTEEEFVESLNIHWQRLVDDIVERIAADGRIDEREQAVIDDLVRRLRLDFAARQRIERATAALTAERILRSPSIFELATALTTADNRTRLIVERNSGPTYDVSAAAFTTWWDVVGKEDVGNSKYNAGADVLVSDIMCHVSRAAPRALQVSDLPVALKTGSGYVYFLPIGCLLYRGGRYSGIGYSDLRPGRVRMRVGDSVPHDATVVGSTWQVVNKDGGRDARIKHNPRYAICEYGTLEFPSREVLLHCSNREVPARLAGLR